MLRTTFARLSLALGLALSAAAATSTARAETEFDVAVNGNRVVVTAKGGWHINKDYPWRLVAGDTQIDKSKFTLSETSASAEAPHGVVKVKGGVCNAGQCVRVDTSVTIP